MLSVKGSIKRSGEHRLNRGVRVKGGLGLLQLHGAKYLQITMAKKCETGLGVHLLILR